MPGALALRYARALSGLVLKPDSDVDPRAVSGDLERFEAQALASADLRVALESPAVAPARKRAVVARLAKELPVSDLVRRFLFVVIDHRRMHELRDIREAFETVMDERLGIVRADVLSARQLTDAQEREVLSSLRQVTGKQARARFTVRPDLVGGIVARIGSTVYDGSVRGQLDALKQRLAGAGRQ